MKIEVRAIRPDELDEFRKVPRYVFADNRIGDGGNEANEPPMEPEWTTCGFVDGRLVTSMAAYPFRMRLNGSAVSVAGVTAVGTYPEYRRGGALRAVMESALREQRERGQSIAILWASMGAIYQRFGYGLASTWQQYEFDPRDVALFPGPDPSGSVRLMDREEAQPIMEQLYIEYSRPRNLMLHRVAPMWQARMQARDGLPWHIGVYRDGAGEPRGYLTYTTKHEEGPLYGPSQRMVIGDLVALDVDAWRGIWDSIRRHDLVRTVRAVMSPDDPAPWLLLEPTALQRRLGDGLWMRVVDVEAALSQRPYGERGSLSLRIVDPMCDWNDATFRLETDGKLSDVTRTAGAADLTMPVRSLAMLLSGHVSATDLARAELLEGGDEEALRLADRVFATAYRPHCPDGF
jgi:predicted acetyltransferase